MERIIVFEDKDIRRIWHNEEWWFSVVDIVRALTGSSDAKDYWYRLKRREAEHGIELSTNCRQLKLQSSDGKKYTTDCSNTEGVFRIIQSIPSRKAEPMKLWLAKAGYERVQEIEDPEIGQRRIRDYYEMKGYPPEWIEKRLRGIAIRQELTEEWRERNVQEGKEFAILTNEISKATFGKTVGEYKDFKGLQKKNENLRDYMNDWELILTMIGEKATSDITKGENSQGFEECKESAQKGGSLAGRTRKDLESTLGKSVISNSGVLSEQKKKRIK